MKRTAFAFLSVIAFIAACDAPSVAPSSSYDASVPTTVRRGGPLTPPGGTITAVHAGANMTGGGIAGSVTLNVATSPSFNQVVAQALNDGFGCLGPTLPATPTVTDSWDPWTTGVGGTCFVDGHRVTHVRVVTDQFGSVLGSLKGGTVGDIVVLENHGNGSESIGNGSLKILNRVTSDHSVPVADHIFTPDLTDIIIPYTGSAVLYYDSNTTGWIAYSYNVGGFFERISVSEMSLMYPLTPSALANGRTDDYDISSGGAFGCGLACASWIRLNGDSGGSQLSGLVPHNVNAGPSSLLSQGQMVFLENVGGDITLCDEVAATGCGSSNSSAGHRFVFTYGDVTVKRSQIVTLIYDQQGGGFLSQARWHMIGTAPSAVNGTAGKLGAFKTGGGSIGDYAGSTSNTCGAGSAASSVVFSSAGAASVTCVAAGSTGGTANYYALWNGASSQTIGSATDDATTFGVNSQFTVTEKTGDTKVQGAGSVYGSLTVKPFSTVTKDATSGWYVPASSGEWTTLLAGSSVSNPSHLWLMQESSGTLADTIGSTTLTNTGTLSYQQSVTGWSRKAMSAPNSNGHYYLFNNTDAALPNSATTSFATLIIMTIDGASGTRDVFLSGNCNGVLTSVTSTPKIQAKINGTNTTTGSTTIDTNVHAWLIRSNATTSKFTVSTDFDTVPVPWSTPDSTKEIWFGGVCGTAPGMHLLYSTMWVGAAAEFSDAQAQDIIQRIENAGTSSFGEALSMSSNQIHNVADPTSAQDAATMNWVNARTPTNPYALGGVDGALVFDGSTTILGMAPSSSIYTLSRDIMPTSITVNNGVTIKMANYAVFANGTCTNNGTISNDGSNASGTSGGGATATGRFLATVVGGNAGGGQGSTSAPPAVWYTATTAGAGAGGTSGQGNGGGGGASVALGAGPSGGPTSPSTAGVAGDAIRSLMIGYDPARNRYTWGSGGSAGKNGSGTNGGGGGAGGGMAMLHCEAFAGTGNIHARGGAGAAGTTSGGTGGGGGGGGGGGMVFVTYGTGGGGQTIDANGGTGAAAVGDGSKGGDGGSGIVYTVNLSANGTSP
jgi:hypothetical protein